MHHVGIWISNDHGTCTLHVTNARSLARWKRFPSDQLVSLLDHAYRNVPYYQRVFRRENLDLLRLSEDLSHFRFVPILSKDDVRKHGHELLDRRIGRRTLIPAVSSATTGEPIVSWKSKNEQLAAERMLLRERARWDPRLMHGQRAEVRPSQGLNPGSRKITVSGHQLITVNLLDVVSEAPRLIAWLNEAKPKLIVIRMSVARELVALIEAGTIASIRFRPLLVEVTSEHASQQDIRHIEHVFGSPVAVHYGCEETYTVAYSCRVGTLHVLDRAVFVEHGTSFRMNDWRPALVTSLLFRSMPFIRYSLGDMIRLEECECSCGRSGWSVIISRGRLSDRLAGWPSVVGSIFFPQIVDRYCPHNIRDYRVVEQSELAFKVLLVPGSVFRDDFICLFRTVLQSKLRGAQFDIIVVDRIPVHRSKKRVVFCRNDSSGFDK